MSNPHILIAVSGGIAAYKALDLVSQLSKTNAQVKVIMTSHATKFVSPLSFEALSHHPVQTEEFDSSNPDPIAHIELAKWADIVCVVPATANCIAKIVHGIADDLVTSTLLACTCPKIICPAMNVHMLNNPITQHNLHLAQQYGWHIVQPQFGLLACQDTGNGKLASTTTIYNEIFKVLSSASQDEQPLKGLSVLISAGPTQEALDPVRFLTNHSSGKQGFALAKAAQTLGAKVTLVSGPVHLSAPYGIDVISITSAQDLEKEMILHAPQADFIIMAAAVADYRPKEVSTEKIKKKGDCISIEFVKNPDILQTLGKQKRDDQILCGFAMETENLEENAKKKLLAKHCDLLVANNLKTPGAGFQTDTNVVSILTPHQIEKLPLQNKDDLSQTILLKMLELKKEK